MLNSREHGYAVMNKNKSGYSFESRDLETCVRYCCKGDIVCTRTPVANGFSISVSWWPFYKWIKLKGRDKNIFNIHFYFSKNYRHKTGVTVYKNV